MKRISIAVIVMMIVFHGSFAFGDENEWICPNCGATATQNFCSECGESKPSEEWVCSNCGEIATGKFCGNCGISKEDALGIIEELDSEYDIENTGEKGNDQSIDQDGISEYASFFEHSELEWYLSQNYGNDAISHYYFYDFDETEGDMLVAFRLDNENLPRIVVHGFNAGISDWYLYDHGILESKSTEIVGYTEEGIEVEKNPLYVGYIQEEMEFEKNPSYANCSFYSTCNLDGFIEKLFLCTNEEEKEGYLQSFSYNEEGLIDHITYCQTSLYEAFFNPPSQKTRKYKYQYEMGKLRKVFDYYGEEESDCHWEFYYDENGKRKEIDYINKKDETLSSLVFERDERDYVCTAISTDYRYPVDDPKPYTRSILVTYLPGGLSEYSS